MPCPSHAGFAYHNEEVEAASYEVETCVLNSEVVQILAAQVQALSGGGVSSFTPELPSSARPAGAVAL